MPVRDQDPVVSCNAGKIRGRSRDGVNRFLGIPYAEPPIGELRWKPSRRLGPFTDEFNAEAFGSACIQNKPQISKTYTLPEHIRFSEDCLTLNIWAPEDVANAAVLFWIHGGSLVIGSSSEPMYDGQALAKKGIIVVTVNYRLGIFGWLAHPHLSAEQDGFSGNYGLGDQIRALEWVQENIAAFGGDPANIIIAGESAGALSAVYLMVSPPARGLFHKVIAQSPYLFSMPHLKEPAFGSPSAEQIGMHFCNAVGVSSLADLRAIRAEDLARSAARHAYPTSGVVDGRSIPDQLISILDQGNQAPVPVLTGFNQGEIRSLRALAPTVPASPDGYVQEIRRLYGERAGSFLELYPATDMEESIIAATRDALYLFGSHKLAEAQISLGKSAYVYLWDHGYPAAEKEGQHAFHGSEVPFIFGNLRNTGPYWPPVQETPDQQSAANDISQMWVSFVKAGEPLGREKFRWPSYCEDESSVHFANTPRMRIERGMYRAEYEFFRNEIHSRLNAGSVPWNWNVGLLQPDGSQ